MGTIELSGTCNELGGDRSTAELSRSSFWAARAGFPSPQGGVPIRDVSLEASDEKGLQYRTLPL